MSIYNVRKSTCVGAKLCLNRIILIQREIFMFG